tara:strand:- start:735 stop:1298 length:564 start_codon:yes stop_codon:yes gene_type:complete
MITGAFSSTTGFADTVMTTNGDIVYYNSGRQRLGKGDDGQFLKLASGLPSWATASGAWVGTATSDLDMSSYDLVDMDFLQLANQTELTISSGAVTFSQSYHSIDTEADESADDLDGFNGLTTGALLVLQSVNNSRDVTLRSGISGSAKMNGVGNYSLADRDFRWTGLAYTTIATYTIYELSRSSNSS